MHVLEPPPLPEGSVYASYYCEENAYKLVDEFISRHTVIDAWDVFAVFISNTYKSVIACTLFSLEGLRLLLVVPGSIMEPKKGGS
jgi:hypothetical protein